MGFNEDMPNVDVNDIFNNIFSQQGHPFGQMFGNMFGFNFPGQQQEPQKKKCPEKVIDIEVSLDDMYNGTRYKSFVYLQRSCNDCKGDGGSYSKCKSCNGEGRTIKTIKNGFMTQNIINACNECNQTGKVLKAKCNKCNGIGTNEESFPIDIDIVKGTPNNFKFVITNQGNDKKDHIRGDLCIIVKELKHPKYERIGHDLIYNVDISLLESISGFQFNLKYFNNKIIELKSKNIVKHKQESVIEGYGMPIINSNRYGNLVIKFNVIYPNDIIDKELIESIIPNNVKHEKVDTKDKEIIPITIKKNL